MLRDKAGEPYRLEDDAPEPADLLLKAERGEEVYLQVTEAVDSHRIRTTDMRNRYGTAVWQKDVELRKAYRGVRVALIDGGEARDLPSLSTKEGREVLQELSSALGNLLPVVNSLPTNKEGQLRGKETWVDIPSASMRLHVRLLRYALNLDENPAEWLWTGGHQIREGDVVEKFLEIIEQKAIHYAGISSPFWLVVFSLDPYCPAAEAKSIARRLKETDHPFDRVYLFFPRGSGGRLDMLFPDHRDFTSDIKSEEKKLLFKFYPQDAMPRWDDPRWQPVNSRA